MTPDRMPTGEPDNLNTTPIDETSLGIVDTTSSDVHKTHLSDAVHAADDMVTSADDITDKHLADLDPDTARYIEKANATPEVQPKKSRVKALVAGGALLAAAAAGGFVAAKALGGGEDNNAPTSAPGNSAPEKPGTPDVEAEPQAPASSLEALDNVPTEAQIQDALQPITVENYPTPEAALERMGQIWKVIVLGGEADLNTHQETPDSAVEREALLENLMYDRAPMEGLYGLRNNMAHELAFPNDEISWQQTWKSTGVNEYVDGGYSGEVEVETITNIPHLDAGYQLLFSDMEPHMLSYHPVSLIEVDGSWKLIGIGDPTSIISK